MEHVFNLLVGYFEHFTYLGIYLVLVFSGAGLPVPEEAVLLSSGYIAHLGYTRLSITIPVCLVGMISGDLVTFYIGRRAGQGIFRTFLIRWAITEERLQRIRRYYEKYGRKTVFFSRYLAGVRQASYFMAGAMGVPLKDFLPMEMLAACSTGPLSITIAYLLGGEIDLVLDYFGVARLIGVVVAILAIAGFVVWRYRRAHRAAAPQEPSV
jgi:membrane protein DedA with SNARE-associated domain